MANEIVDMVCFSRVQDQTFAWLISVGCLLSTCPLVADETLQQVKAYERHALTHTGNAQRGQRFFWMKSLPNAQVCHRLNENGGEAGPDLSAIGGKFDRPHLIESLLDPSRQIVEGYRSTVCLLKSGEVVTGIVKEQVDQQMTLVDANRARRMISLTEIEEKKESPVSLMPVGLHETLTPEQFTDLIAFLESCRSGVKGTPGSQVAGGIELPAGFPSRR